jgi:delta 1-pyrroline-5-carboxylate dehydrogenase
VQQANRIDKGTFVPPTAIELPNLDDLEREVLVLFCISLPISMVNLSN